MATGLSEVRARVAAAAQRVGRDPAWVTLVAVSKGATPDAIRAAYADGVRDFGENRADLLVAHAALIPDDARWHFIGRLQGNKVVTVRPRVHLLHSLDRLRLGGYWGSEPAAPPVLLQVNVSGEPQKAGFPPDQAARAVDALMAQGLEVRGLMTMAPLSADPEASRPWFQELRRLRDRLGRDTVQELSMGMTDDFEVAVEEGATILRVGRAIFGSSPHED